MRIVVLYDDDGEGADAHHLAEVIEKLAPELMHADIEVKLDATAHGTMTRTVVMRQGRWSHRLHSLKVFALQSRDVFAQSTDQALRMEVAFGDR